MNEQIAIQLQQVDVLPYKPLAIHNLTRICNDVNNEEVT